MRYARHAHVDAPSKIQRTDGSAVPLADQPAGAAQSGAAVDALADDRPAAAVPAQPEAATRAAVVGPALRLWLRYLVPLTLLSAVAMSPVIALAMRLRTPANAAEARAAVALGSALLALAWLGQLMLVGAAAAMLRERRSQLRALGAGLLQLVRSIVPCGVAAAAVLLGCLALVVPGPVLLVALSLTAASPARGLPAPLLDSVSAVRRQWLAAALAVIALFALDAAIGIAAHRVLVAALPAKPTPPQLAAVRAFVRTIAAALVVVSPLPACLLARLHARVARSGTAFT